MMSLPLRLFWTVYVTILVGFGALALGPGIEGSLFPIRVHQSIADTKRAATLLRFDWVSVKQRMAEGLALDVALFTPSDRFEVTLYNDLSLPGEPHCTRIAPWARSRAVSVGPHRQPYCVEIPPGVGPKDQIELVVVAHYAGLWHLWDIGVAFPHIVFEPVPAP